MIDAEDVRVTNAKAKIAAAKEKLKKDKASSEVSEDLIKEKEEKIAKAESALAALEEKLKKGKAMVSE